MLDSGWLKLLDLSGPSSFACFVTCGAISYGHSDSWLLMATLPDWVVAFANVGLFFFGALAAVWVLRGIVGWLQSAVRKRGRARRVNQQLDSLSQDERKVFSYLLNRGQNAFPCSLADPTVGVLVQRGLVIRGAGQHSIVNWPHIVPPYVWDVLLDRRDEFR